MLCSKVQVPKNPRRLMGIFFLLRYGGDVHFYSRKAVHLCLSGFDAVKQGTMYIQSCTIVPYVQRAQMQCYFLKPCFARPDNFS